MRRVLAVAAGAIGALALAASGTVAVPAVAAEAMTTVTMTVTGCEGCTITPSQYRTGMTTPWSGKGVKVVGGVATLIVPTARTNGMVFAIDATWRVEINAQPLITMQYQGAAPGGTVTRAQAIAAKKGTACWAGATGPSAALTVTVSRVLMPAFPNDKHTTRVPLAWVTPTPSAPGGFSSAYKGVLATQDVWVCP